MKKKHAVRKAKTTTITATTKKQKENGKSMQLESGMILKQTNK